MLVVSVRVFPEEISIGTGELRPTDSLPQGLWASANLFRVQIEQEGKGGQILSLPELRSQLLCSGKGSPGSQAFRFRLGLTQPRFSGLQIWTQ